jgi:cytochrome c-type biogenesis protein CcmH
MTIIFWVLAATAAVLCAFWVLRSAARAPARSDDPEAAVYRDQLAELERDRARGLIGDAEFDAARLEIGRRLASVADAAGPAKASISPRWVMGLAAIAPLAALGLYLWLGAPGVPDQPFQTRRAELAARAASDPGALRPDELIALLEEDARDRPDDPRPHLFLGQVLASQGRYDDALRATQAALRRDPKNPDALVQAGVTLIELNQGKVDDQSRRLFSAALVLQPANPAPMLYLGLAEHQAGRTEEAFNLWRTGFAALKPDDPRRMAFAAGVADALSQLERGPGEQAPAMAAGMGAGDRQAFIRQMVASRGARAAANPRDVAAQLSFARVAAVMGQRDEAIAALRRGRAASGNDPLLTAIYQVAEDFLPTPPPAGAASAPPAPGGGPAGAPVTPSR